MKPVPQFRFQLAIVAEESPRRIAPDGLKSIDWLLCKRAGDQSLEFYRGDDLLSSVDLDHPKLDLPNLVGIIVTGPEDLFETIREQWTSKLKTGGVVFKHVAQFDEPAILSAAMECLAEALQAQRSHAGLAALELAAFRTEFERLQRCFSLLEAHASRQSFQRKAQIFEYAPASAVDGVGRLLPNSSPSSVNRSFTQYLPVDSFGVSGLAFHLSGKSSGTQPLHVTLRAIETETTFGVWSVNNGAGPGWVELALTRAIDEPALTLEAIFEWPVGGDGSSGVAGWALSLGPPHPYQEFRVRTEAGLYLSAPFALRIYSTLPGVRVPSTTGALRPLGAPQLLGEFVPYEAYATVAQVFPALGDEKPALVAYDREIGCITVHPRLGGSVTAARLDIPVPPRAWQLTAHIHLAHERASNVSFALFVCPPGEGSRLVARLEQLEESSPTFSGWTSLSSLERKSISVPVVDSADHRMLLFLLTRLSPEDSPDFAWARFAKFEFSIKPATLLNEKAPAETALLGSLTAAVGPHAGSL